MRYTLRLCINRSVQSYIHRLHMDLLRNEGIDSVNIRPESYTSSQGSAAQTKRSNNFLKRPNASVYCTTGAILGYLPQVSM